MKGQSKHFAKEKKLTRRAAVSLSVLAVSLAALGGAFFYADQKNSRDQANSSNAGELRVLSQQIAKNASEATTGKVEAFVLLKDARNQFDQRFTNLKNVSSLPTTHTLEQGYSGNTQISALGAAWNALKFEADNILSAEEKILALHSTVRTLEEIIPQLQIEYDGVIELFLDNEASAEQVAIAQRQPWLAERILKSANSLLSGGGAAVVAADSLSRDTELFERILTGMINGNSALGIAKVSNEEAIDRLAEIADLFKMVQNSVSEILEASPQLFQVRKASNQIFTDSQQLLQQTSILASSYAAASEARFFERILLGGAGLMVLFSLFLVALSINREARKRLESTHAQNEANQAAIMRLLDEMEELADGNLTVNATVTEDFTGAIADSINHSIEQLRLLVNTINQTAVEVDNAAQKTQSTAHEVAEASEHQANEIQTATQSINEMAHSIDRISAHAIDSADVAKRSLSIAANGADVVRNTIDGMNTIKDKIQDTSKRLKRLGESSQEIGNIIALINDIADQTNILSLNASIQASMAGEAGRGFAVVADEVQRLSERVTEATKQIETLVSVIQSDTNEAVLSMEQTTSQVINGAQLAQNAGVALEEIEDVSSNLATLIHNISDTATAQAESAAKISSRMKVIRDITLQTSSGTNATAGSIGDLAEMALEMRKTVSGFRLKETES
ncbi:MAG: methyl-accepting chemotaxis protein [Endozoicomonas sp. (ex Botrylloides leachii)]|nr:methyl-accepting chemotaxis protein [Endozoicomonas sp. (ex Botrylloides leachii)]